MKYECAPELQRIVEEVSQLLFPHVKIPFVKCIRSYGSSARGTIARCHSLGKAMQTGMGIKAFYTIEFISEEFDKLSEEDKVKTIIHELMHIPFSFGGGFKHHDHVTDRNVNKHYIAYKKKKEEKESFLKRPSFSVAETWPDEINEKQKNLFEI